MSVSITYTRHGSKMTELQRHKLLSFKTNSQMPTEIDQTAKRDPYRSWLHFFKKVKGQGPERSE